MTGFNHARVDEEFFGADEEYEGCEQEFFPAVATVIDPSSFLAVPCVDFNEAYALLRTSIFEQLAEPFGAMESNFQSEHELPCRHGELALRQS